MFSYPLHKQNTISGVIIGLVMYYTSVSTGLTPASIVWTSHRIPPSPCSMRSWSLLWRRPAPSVWSDLQSAPTQVQLGRERTIWKSFILTEKRTNILRWQLTPPSSTLAFGHSAALWLRSHPPPLSRVSQELLLEESRLDGDGLKSCTLPFLLRMETFVH